VPTSPLIVPSVQLAAAWPSTVKPAAALDEALLDLEKNGADLMLDAGLLDVASLHAADSSATAPRIPAANLE
jgi:hypothetical protein